MDDMNRHATVSKRDTLSSTSGYNYCHELRAVSQIIMSAGKSFQQRSLAGAMVSALLFASPVAASDPLGLPELASAAHKQNELRPSSSDTFEPQYATTPKRGATSDPLETRFDPGDDARALTKHLGGNPGNRLDPMERLSDSIQKSHIFPQNGKFKIMRNGDIIALSTYRHPYGKEIDMKIDALLVAREVQKSGVVGVDTVMVYFFNETDQGEYTTAAVDLALVKQFNGRQINNAELFESLKLRRERLGEGLSELSNQTYDEISSNPHPGDGILRKERADLVKQIEKLQNRGANVNSLQTAYLLLEDAIRQNDDLGARAAYAFAIEILENAKLKLGISSFSKSHRAQ
jgi:hypothetical protein